MLFNLMLSQRSLKLSSLKNIYIYIYFCCSVGVSSTALSSRWLILYSVSSLLLLKALILFFSSIFVFFSSMTFLVIYYIFYLLYKFSLFIHLSQFGEHLHVHYFEHFIKQFPYLCFIKVFFFPITFIRNILLCSHFPWLSFCF